MYIYSLAVISGILIGSFLNVCIYRMPKNESIIYPASHCSKCNESLKPFDLIPIFSYVSLRGKCRYCSAEFSIRYPMIEFLTGIIFLLVFYKYDLSIAYFFHIALVCILICITFIDYDHQIIPDGLVILGFGLGLTYKFLLYFFINQPIEVLNSLLGFLLGGGFFLLIAVISNGGMGGGDIKLIAMLGFWFGWRDIILISFLSFIIGSVISIALLATKVKSRKDVIPFGPFIGVSTLLVILYKNYILMSYMNLFM
ncbi:leader peptidase (prepilin peptidase) / N-methyltransferase [Anaerovirgula multivorans]|uniref:Prepilin leader peptidase/N-methyltransferase n=1 Tax=Anaerovirgula multivorans TaxID=312168 RepID=A0A238ZU99_9FIRM|nr:A24 family peptidase [Anaerovirgula multivorans]SNR86488.1 leader peptidase (prepilin peptidase) / N-methyltransferase [Anaerovirgula multivorans]